MDHFELTMYVFIYMLGYVLTAGLGLLRSVLFGSEAQRSPAKPSEAQRPLVLRAQRPLVLRAQRPPDWANTFAPATAGLGEYIRPSDRLPPEGAASNPP